MPKATAKSAAPKPPVSSREKYVDYEIRPLVKESRYIPEETKDIEKINNWRHKLICTGIQVKFPKGRDIDQESGRVITGKKAYNIFFSPETTPCLPEEMDALKITSGRVPSHLKVAAAPGPRLSNYQPISSMYKVDEILKKVKEDPFYGTGFVVLGITQEQKNIELSGLTPVARQAAKVAMTAVKGQKIAIKSQLAAPGGNVVEPADDEEEELVEELEEA